MKASKMIHSHQAVQAVCQKSLACATRVWKVKVSNLPTSLCASCNGRSFRIVLLSSKLDRECLFKIQLQRRHLGNSPGSGAMVFLIERGTQVRSTQPGVVAESSDDKGTGTGTDTHSDTKKTDEASDKLSNGAAVGEALPSGEMEFVKLGLLDVFLVRLNLLLAWPWQRVAGGSVLKMKLGGEIAERYEGRFGTVVSLPQVCRNLMNAAHDPRIAAVFLQIQPLACGWGKIDEIRRHVEYFKKSGKPIVGYLSIGGEKEYYLACACGELYAPPAAYISLRGLKVQASFVGGVLEKVGIEPELQRIGKYKSFGDTITRKEMSEANREMLTAILDDVFESWSEKIVASTGRTRDELLKLLEEGEGNVEKLKADGWITDIKYEDEVDSLLKKKIGANEEKALSTVSYKKYSRVKPSTLGLAGGHNRIAVIRAVGGIRLSKGGGGGIGSQDEGIAAETLIETIRSIGVSKNYKAVVLRIDSPGGDALASDLIWREIRLLAEKKPVVASMVDVAASGGYYMAMAAGVIVAEELTLTGSIGVVTGKFNFQELYGKIGYGKEVISKGRFADLNADQRGFTPDEGEYFKQQAMTAYKIFRDKAAFSRKMKVDAMENVAQGRVWTGKAALSRGLVDAIGGFNRAVAIAKQKAGIAASAPVTLVELTRKKPNLVQFLLQGGVRAPFLSLDVPSIRDSLGMAELVGLLGKQEQRVQARMDDIQVESPGRIEPPQASADDISVLGLGNCDDVISILARRLGNVEDLK